MPNLRRFCSRSTVPLLLAALGVAQALRPARPRREPFPIHVIRDGAFAMLGALIVGTIERPAAIAAGRFVQSHRWGIAQRLLPQPLRDVGAILLLDYTLYLWHRETHRRPFLWRFHAVHHADLDLDSLTALRFHFGELLLSIPWRLAQILMTGASPRAYDVWQRLLTLSICFHHANITLPPRTSRLLSFLIGTPEMHAVHHSVDPLQQNRNFTSGLSLWDRMHGSFDGRRPHTEIGLQGVERTNDALPPSTT